MHLIEIHGDNFTKTVSISENKSNMTAVLQYFTTSADALVLLDYMPVTTLSTNKNK